MFSKIDAHEVVTFDVFDTLIKRDTYSFKDIVKMMNKLDQEKNGKHLPVYFYRERLHASKIVRRKKNKNEANLDEIYEELHIDDSEKIKNYEIQIEIDSVVANPKIKEVYEYCKKKNKKIYAISDMYLSREVIDKMLKKAGYDINKIYVSQEYDQDKISGKLFKIFLKSEKLQANKVIHIGDNRKADIYGAAIAEIDSIEIENRNDKPVYLKRGTKVQNHILYKFINNRVDKYDNRLEKIGYEVLGPILYYYVKWLRKKIEENKFENVFFLSRDGYLMYNAYLKMYPESKARYIHISSKSVKKATIDAAEREKLIEYLKQNGFIGKVAIIDVGWEGNLHKMLKGVSKEFAEMYGLYLGVTYPFYENVQETISKGYIDCSKYICARVKMSAGFIELLFSETEKGTTEGYSQGADSVEPILSEKNPNGKCIRELQRGALQFVNDWHRTNYSKFDFSTKELIAPILELAINPYMEDVELLANEYLGSGKKYERMVEDVDKKMNLIEYMKMLRDVKWKGGFIRKTLKYNFYNKMYGVFNPLLLIKKI